MESYHPPNVGYGSPVSPRNRRPTNQRYVSAKPLIPTNIGGGVTRSLPSSSNGAQPSVNIEAKRSERSARGRSPIQSRETEEAEEIFIYPSLAIIRWRLDGRSSDKYSNITIDLPSHAESNSIYVYDDDNNPLRYVLVPSAINQRIKLRSPVKVTSEEGGKLVETEGLYLSDNDKAISLELADGNKIRIFNPKNIISNQRATPLLQIMLSGQERGDIHVQYVTRSLAVSVEYHGQIIDEKVMNIMPKFIVKNETAINFSSKQTGLYAGETLNYDSYILPFRSYEGRQVGQSQSAKYVVASEVGASETIVNEDVIRLVKMDTTISPAGLILNLKAFTVPYKKFYEHNVEGTNTYIIYGFKVPTKELNTDRESGKLAKGPLRIYNREGFIGSGQVKQSDQGQIVYLNLGKTDLNVISTVNIIPNEPLATSEFISSNPPISAGNVNQEGNANQLNLIQTNPLGSELQQSLTPTQSTMAQHSITSPPRKEEKISQVTQTSTNLKRPLKLSKRVATQPPTEEIEINISLLNTRKKNVDVTMVYIAKGKILNYIRHKPSDIIGNRYEWDVTFNVSDERQSLKLGLIRLKVDDNSS